MDIAALVAWLVTATGGFVLLGIWVAKGGVRQAQEGESRFPPAVIFGHFLLAAVGLVIWIVYVISDETTALAWTAFGILLPVAALGFVMLARWWAEHRAVAGAVEGTGGLVTGAAESASEAGPAGEAPAEQRFPLAVVVLHGLAAVTTLVLVLLAALASG